MKICFLAASMLILGIETSTAAPLSIMIGDNDGHGFGAAVVPDNSGGVPWTVSSPYGPDNRTPDEIAGADGRQYTDYSARLGVQLPNPIIFRFALPANLVSANLTVDMGGFQAATAGQVDVSYNNVLQPNLFNFQDGPFQTTVRQFTLTPSAIANANAEGEFVISVFDPPGIFDVISIDFLKLEGTVIPEPTSGLLLLTAGLTVLARRRRLKNM